MPSQTLQTGRTICCIGTGPSVTQAQVDTARRRGFVLYVCNDAYKLAPDAALLHACNWQWWDARWEVVKDLPAEKWTTRPESAAKYGINYIEERDGKAGGGLSENPAYLYHGHGSGFQLMGMAYRARPARIVMLGYDLRYAADYDGFGGQVGSTPRHFFGEYEKNLAHFPKYNIRDGVHLNLVKIYTAAAEQPLRCPIIQCSPGSALTAFPMANIEDV